MAAVERIKTYHEGIDTVLGGGIKKNGVTLIYGHEKSAGTRVDLCHRFSVVSQISEEEDEIKKVMYLDFSRACSIRPDKMLLTSRSLPLDGERVLKNVTYGRIPKDGDMLRHQNELITRALNMIRKSRGFVLLILNNFPVEVERYSRVELQKIAERNRIAIIININAPHSLGQGPNDDIKSVYFNEINEILPAETLFHIVIEKEAELKFPSKGLTGETIFEAMETISDSNAQFWHALQLWGVATKLRHVYKKKSIRVEISKASIHLLLCTMAFTLEQLKEFKMPRKSSISIIGLIVASVGAFLWACEIWRKWGRRERKWYNWPFFPATVGLIVELNQVGFYIASLVHPGDPPRMVVSGLLFHVSNVIRLMAKEKKKEIKKKRMDIEV